MSRASTGATGLDDILAGGLPRDRIYLLQGDPGVGKTTLGLQFLLAGASKGERCLYITMSETAEEIQAVIKSHGWNSDGIEFVELSAVEQSSVLESSASLFEPSEVELQETTRVLLSHVERVKPDRVVFDSLSELRLLAQSALRYRRQILGLKQYFVGKRATVLLLDDRTSEPGDLQLQSLAHGVIHLEQIAPIYGEDRRRLRIIKLRGIRFRGGYHDFSIETGGLVVYPRLVAAEHHVEFERKPVSSGLPHLDKLLGGGIDAGTAMLITGPAGSGKSAISVQYAAAAARRGDCVGMFIFDERIATLHERSKTLGTDIQPLIDSKHLILQQVDPAEMSPGELAHRARMLVEKNGAKLIVIDSLNGYLNAMPDEQLLTVQLHELLSYLSHAGVTSLLVMVQHGLLGAAMQTTVDVSYLSDTVLLLRYFEAGGRIRKAISVVKKRSGAHENAIRELTLDSSGIHVGDPLEEFSGVLTGVPQYRGKLGDLSK